MAKMQLPSLNARTTPRPSADTTPGQVQAQAEGPVFVTPAVDPDAAADAQRDRSVDIGDEPVEGMTSEVVTTTAQPVQTQAQPVQAQQPAADMPRWGTPPTSTPLSPRLAADDIAKLDEMARSLLEVRSIAVAAQAAAAKHPDAIANLHVRINTLESGIGYSLGTLKEEAKALHKLIADEHTHSLGLDDDIAMLRSRLDAVDTMLSSRGLPTTASVANKATLKLHPRRRVVHAAQLDGDAVVLYYNPRQGHDGNDNQEFQLSKDNVRNVWSGYQVEVPPGYVADVFVDSDVITSLKGRTDGEFILKMVSRGATRTISSGGEICRLTLRKIEPVRLEVVQ